MSTVLVASDPRKAAIRRELETTRDDFHALAQSMRAADWGRPSQNPGWTNGEVLFHMTLAFLLLPLLLPLIRLFSRLPRACSRAFALLLNLATPLFNWANGLAPRIGARLFPGRRLVAKFDQAHARVLRLLDALPAADMDRSMRYPDRWEPLFRPDMTIEDLFRYPTIHFRFHRDQLAMPPTAA